MEIGEYCPLCGKTYKNHLRCDGCAILLNPDSPDPLNSKLKGHCSGKGIKREKYLFCSDCSSRLDKRGVLRLGFELIAKTEQGIQKVLRREYEGGQWT